MGAYGIDYCTLFSDRIYNFNLSKIGSIVLFANAILHTQLEVQFIYDVTSQVGFV